VVGDGLAESAQGLDQTVLVAQAEAAAVRIAAPITGSWAASAASIAAMRRWSSHSLPFAGTN
jgi:hypothetical protein